MEIKKAKYEVELTNDEMYELGCIIIHQLENSIKSHYNELQQEKDGEPVFFEHKKKELAMMKFFFEATGRAEMYGSYVNEFKRLFAEKREERKKLKNEGGDNPADL